MIWLYILAIITGYLIGSISPSYILGKLIKGIDIRKYGTKNAGTMNAFRTIGKGAGITTLIFDLIKAALAMFIAYLLLFGARFSFDFLAGTPFVIMCLTGFVAILGHDFPFYMQFKGGKGAASAWGIILALMVLSIVKEPLLATWIPFIIAMFFGLSILAITKSANLTSFIIYPLASILLLILKPGAMSIAISLFFLYLIIACIMTVFQKKGLKNDMKFAKKREEIRVWRKSLRFVFLIFPIIYFWLDKNSILIILGILTLIFLIFDFTKIKQNKIIRHLYKKSEMKKSISGITLFLVGALITTFFFSRSLAILAMIFAAVGDNFAVLLGIPFGRHKLFRGKSIEGTIACLASSFGAGLIAIPFLNVSILFIVIGALATTIAELFSGAYDNVVMAPFAALVMSLIRI